ncbi:MAG: DNA-protecting protein DprA [Clostridiales bacterium]|jgi:DNA processing protein|nr:DNA-protecting protein DprA [Clostridiales bacterium]HOC07927.1 DNA-processing protein DprA [Bacillota bacterium]
MEQDKYLIWLSGIRNIGGIRIKRLIEHFGSAKSVWEAGREDLEKVKGIDRGVIRQILAHKNEARLEHCLYSLERHNISTIPITSDYYPALLKEIYNPPYLLYVKGDRKALEGNCIAIVGSRNASYYGKKVAFKLAEQLARAGFNIVSGFARGIDSYAHKGALAVGGKTIAVMGNGLDVVYPRENYQLMKEISGGGLLLSEYPPGTSPLRGNFPARNRLISGLSLGVVVVEASERSGALITADFALEQNREVFAVPGNINSATSAGTNNLIKQGAKIVNRVEDILEEFPFAMLQSREKKDDDNGLIGAGTGKTEDKVLRMIGQQPVHIDDLLSESGLRINQLNALLTHYEVEGLIQRLPGNYFVAR